MNAPSSMACLSSRPLHLEQHHSKRSFAVCDPASFSRMKSQTLLSDAPSLDLPNFLTFTFQASHCSTNEAWMTKNTALALGTLVALSLGCFRTLFRTVPSDPKATWDAISAATVHGMANLHKFTTSDYMPSFWSAGLRHASCSRSKALYPSGEWDLPVSPWAAPIATLKLDGAVGG